MNLAYLNISAGPPITSPLLYSSYEDQQRDEIGKMLAAVGGFQELILMGDFNTGPASSQTTAVSPSLYNLIISEGFVSPFFLLDGRCTSCEDNILRILTGATGNLLLDHIFTITAISNNVQSVNVRTMYSICLPSECMVTSFALNHDIS